MSEALHTKYRPAKLDEVIGQKAAIKSLSGIIKRRESQAFLFSGPAGVGKTTLARITASELGCKAGSIQEVPAAIHTGVDAMRSIADTLQYRSFGANPERAIILDECHRLSTQAWDSLLKIIEEPPKHVFWFFCTTNVAKVPKTIQTRCTHIQLKSVSDSDLEEIYDNVCEAENIDVPADIGKMIVKEAQGSARQLLVNLAACRDVRKKAEAAEVLRTALETDGTIELCRYIAGGKTNWPAAMAIVKKIEDQNYEGVRIIVMNYMGSALKGAKTEREAAFFLKVLDCFSQPYNPAEGIAPLLLSIGRCLFSE